MGLCVRNSRMASDGDDRSHVLTLLHRNSSHQATIIAFMVVIGWELGTIEGVCITILVGFAVDYVVRACSTSSPSAAPHPRTHVLFVSSLVDRGAGAHGQCVHRDARA